METNTVCRDALLDMEALTFRGLSRPFPPHFHSCYVVGLMDEGRRLLTCRGRTWTASEGDILLFAPGDSHGCTQEGAVPLSYRSLHIPPRQLEALAGGPVPALATVFRQPELFDALSLLHRMILSGSPAQARLDQRQEALTRLLRLCARPPLPQAPQRQEVAAACRYLQRNCGRRLTLQEVCRQVGLSPSSLRRAFRSEVQLTPYRYLEALRVEEAAALLRQGTAPAEAALSAGFADQSHLTHLFRALMGCSPGAYQVSAGEGESPPQN